MEVSTSTERFFACLIPGQIGIWNRFGVTGRKTSRSKGENQQQTQSTCGIEAGIWTRSQIGGRGGRKALSPLRHPLLSINNYEVMATVRKWISHPFVRFNLIFLRLLSITSSSDAWLFNPRRYHRTHRHTWTGRCIGNHKVSFKTYPFQKIPVSIWYIMAHILLHIYPLHQIAFHIYETPVHSAPKSGI